MYKKQLCSQAQSTITSAENNLSSDIMDHASVKRSVALQMRMTRRKEKASTIEKQKRVLLKPNNQIPLQSKVNEESENKNTSNYSSQVKVYHRPGETPRKAIFNHKDPKKKTIGVDIIGRGKSLNYKKVETNSPKFLTQVRHFFNTFISEDDGCLCGSECKWATSLINWVGVSQDKISKNYCRLIAIAYQDKPKNSPESFELLENFAYEESALFRKETTLEHLKQIQKDVIRTQRECKLFLKKEMQDKMERILLCYAIEDPEVGYVQSMNIIVSSILYHVRDEAKTFAIVRKIFHQMRTVYLKDFKECYEHIKKIELIMKSNTSDLFHHLDQMGINFHIVMFSWVISLMCIMVPLEKLHRIIIGFIRDSWGYIYKVILCFLLYNKENLMRLNEVDDVLIFLSGLKEEKHRVEWDGIFNFVERVKID